MIDNDPKCEIFTATATTAAAESKPGASGKRITGIILEKD
jgi:hypothetical protein